MKGQGLVNCEASKGLSSPRWPRQAQGQGWAERSPSEQHKGQPVEGTARSSCVQQGRAAVLMDTESTCLQKGRAVCVGAEARGLSVSPSPLCLHQAGNFLF